MGLTLQRLPARALCFWEVYDQTDSLDPNRFATQFGLQSLFRFRAR
jgi:hypothetical protein